MEDSDTSVFLLNTEVRFLGSGKHDTDRNTKLIIFLDSTVNPFHVWEKKDIVPDARKSFSVNLYGKKQNCFNELPVNCKVCIRAFQSLPNEFGRPCDMDFGSGSVELSEIIRNQCKEDSGDKGWTTVWLKMHSVTQNYVMSVVQLKMNSKTWCTSTEFIGSKSSQNGVSTMEDIRSDDLDFFLFPPWSDHNAALGISSNVINGREERMSIFKVCSLTINSPCFSELLRDDGSIKGTISRVNNPLEVKLCFEKKKLDEYFERYSLENEFFKDWIKGGDKINCPFYPSQVTVSETQLYLPFSSYVVYEPPKVDKSFWLGALKIMYDRRGFEGEEDYFSFFQKASVETKAIQAMDMVCQYAHLMEYVSDQVINPKTGKKEMIEIFGNACYTLCGDCEDLALVILQLFDDFTLRHQFDSSENTILKEMQTILRVYIPFVCIEGVTCSHAQNQHEIKDENKITGAHASLKCLPRHFFRKCLSSWDEMHPILSSSLSFTAPCAGCSFGYEKGDLKPPFSYLPRVIDSNVVEIEEEWESSLPILLGEGTGMLNSGGEEDPCCPQHRKEVYAIPSVRCAKKPLYPKKGTSPFYKATLFAATNRFLRDFGVATFRFCKKTEGSFFGIPTKPKFERGVFFADLIHMKEHISLVPYGDLKLDANYNGTSVSRREFSPSLTCVLNNTLNVRVKSKALKTTLYDDEGKEKYVTKMFQMNSSPTATYLIKLKQKLDKNRAFAVEGVCENQLCKVLIYYDAYYISHKTCKDLYLNLKDKVCGMDFALERHSDVLSIWRLEFLYPCTR